MCLGRLSPRDLEHRGRASIIASDNGASMEPLERVNHRIRQWLGALGLGETLRRIARISGRRKNGQRKVERSIGKGCSRLLEALKSCPAAGYRVQKGPSRLALCHKTVV